MGLTVGTQETFAEWMNEKSDCGIRGKENFVWGYSGHRKKKDHFGSKIII